LRISGIKHAFLLVLSAIGLFFEQSERKVKLMVDQTKMISIIRFRCQAQTGNSQENKR